MFTFTNPCLISSECVVSLLNWVKYNRVDFLIDCFHCFNHTSFHPQYLLLTPYLQTLFHKLLAPLQLVREFPCLLWVLSLFIIFCSTVACSCSINCCLSVELSWASVKFCGECLFQHLQWCEVDLYDVQGRTLLTDCNHGFDVTYLYMYNQYK